MNQYFSRKTMNVINRSLKRPVSHLGPRMNIPTKQQESTNYICKGDQFWGKKKFKKEEKENVKNMQLMRKIKLKTALSHKNILNIDSNQSEEFNIEEINKRINLFITYQQQILQQQQQMAYQKVIRIAYEQKNMQSACKVLQKFSNSEIGRVFIHLKQFCSNHIKITKKIHQNILEQIYKLRNWKQNDENYLQIRELQKHNSMLTIKINELLNDIKLQNNQQKTEEYCLDRVCVQKVNFERILLNCEQSITSISAFSRNEICEQVLKNTMQLNQETSSEYNYFNFMSHLIKNIDNNFLVICCIKQILNDKISQISLVGKIFYEGLKNRLDQNLLTICKKIVQKYLKSLRISKNNLRISQTVTMNELIVILKSMTFLKFNNQNQDCKIDLWTNCFKGIRTVNGEILEKKQIQNFKNIQKIDEIENCMIFINQIDAFQISNNSQKTIKDKNKLINYKFDKFSKIQFRMVDGILCLYELIGKQLQLIKMQMISNVICKEGSVMNVLQKYLEKRIDSNYHPNFKETYKIEQFLNNINKYNAFIVQQYQIRKQTVEIIFTELIKKNILWKIQEEKLMIQQKL